MAPNNITPPESVPIINVREHWWQLWRPTYAWVQKIRHGIVKGEPGFTNIKYRGAPLFDATSPTTTVATQLEDGQAVEADGSAYYDPDDTSNVVVAEPPIVPIMRAKAKNEVRRM